MSETSEGRRFYRPRALLWMGVLIVLGILVCIFVCVPIMKHLTLRYYYTQEEIKRQDLRVVTLGGRRDRTIVFSNGDRKRRELPLDLMNLCVVAPFVGAFIWLAYFTRPAKIYDDETDTKADTS